MRYHVLCCDYDGTLAHDGRVSETTIAALERVAASGRRLMMVTGRELPDLERVFDRFDLFEYVVAENGALLYRPADREETTLAEPPPPRFAAELDARGVSPMSVGRVIVATWEPHETTVLETIRDLGLELQVIFNKGAVMVLPAGVNKATGLEAALEAMNLTAHEAVGIGDAENDHAFLSLCECSVAVANALPGLAETADFVTAGDHGAGVAELVEELIADDLAGREPLLDRHRVLLGRDRDGADVHLPAYGVDLAIAGTSGTGKSTIVAALLERLEERGYTFCVVDPEGDYENQPGAVAIGSRERPPEIDEALRALGEPGRSVVVDLLGVPLDERPRFFARLLSGVAELRARTGRPHWLVADEAHHLMPATRAEALPPAGRRRGLVQVTVHPEQVAAEQLAAIEAAVAVGNRPAETLAALADAAGLERPQADAVTLNDGEALFWRRGGGRGPFRVRIELGRHERQRHTRKYAEGDLGVERSFCFRGPEGKLRLRAPNLIDFLELADGVDDETWEHHRRRGDYSSWIRTAIKDQQLGAEIARIEEAPGLAARESRQRVRAAIEERYTLPTKGIRGQLTQ